MTATPTWSNFLINSDAEFHATRCQTQVVRSQRKHDIICTTVLKPDTPDNKTIYLVCGTSTGFINIYVTSKILKPLSHAPLVSFSAHRGPIQKLDWIQRSGQLLLVSAGDEEGRGWDWELIENQVPKTITQTQTITISHVFQFQSEVQIGSRNSSAPRAETNAIIFHDNLLYCGCGDGSIYQFDVSAERVVAKFNDNNTNENYVMSLNKTSSNIYAGYSDGLLKIWDIKSNTVTTTMSPLTGENNVSKGVQIKLDKKPWISAIAMDDREQWMVVGGGTCYATLWYIPQMTLTAVMPTSATINDICVSNEQIATVGNEKNIIFWDKTGKFRTKVTTEIPSILSISRVPGLDTDAYAVSGRVGKIGLVVHDRIGMLD